uniref:Uncharacterized protein n=1 Tax=Arundo donax TaxID=35708 RepID=A0A0A9C6C6_ARUDO
MRFYPSIKNLPPWFVLSLTLPLRFFVLTLLGSIFLESFISFFRSRALLLNSLVLVLMLRTVLLSASIVIFLRLLVLL